MEAFSEGVERALRASLEAHSGQLRKGEPVPYVSHPVHVAVILARVGADEAALQAALLHDVVEDCDGWTVERVHLEFGPEVAETVRDLTEEPHGTWEDRKGAALAQVAKMGPRSLAVKAADKLHNVQSLVSRLREAVDSAAVWKVFSRGPELSIQHAEDLAHALGVRLAEVGRFETLGAELRLAVEELRRLHP